MANLELKEFWTTKALLYFVNTNNIEVVSIGGIFVLELFYRNKED